MRRRVGADQHAKAPLRPIADNPRSDTEDWARQVPHGFVSSAQRARASGRSRNRRFRGWLAAGGRTIRSTSQTEKMAWFHFEANEAGPARGRSGVLIKSCVRIVVWATKTLMRSLIPRSLLAVGVLALSAIVLLYAAWFAALMWLTCGQHGIVRAERWRAPMRCIVGATAIVTLIIDGASAGRTPANLAFIAATATAGLLVQVRWQEVRWWAAHDFRRVLP